MLLPGQDDGHVRSSTSRPSQGASSAPRQTRLRVCWPHLSESHSLHSLHSVQYEAVETWTSQSTRTLRTNADDAILLVSLPLDKTKIPRKESSFELDSLFLLWNGAPTCSGWTEAQKLSKTETSPFGVSTLRHRSGENSKLTEARFERLFIWLFFFFLNFFIWRYVYPPQPRATA